MGTSEPTPDPNNPDEALGTPVAQDPTSTPDATTASTGDASSQTSETAVAETASATSEDPVTAQAAAAADPTTPTDSSDPAAITPPESDPGVTTNPSQSDPTTPLDPAVQAGIAATQASADDLNPTVPEQRPQVFTGPIPGHDSDSAKRAAAAAAPAATQEDYDRANSDEAKEAATAAGRLPNFLVGQRVQIVGDHPEAGRMAHVTAIEYASGVDALLGTSATPEARFAEVEDYVIRTRDGRSDLLTATADQLKPLDTIQGWGRGQI